MLGTVSYFKNGLGGDHNFKLGGEIFDESVKDVFIDGSRTTSCTYAEQRQARRYPVQPGESIGGLRTYGAFLHDTWRVNNQMSSISACAWIATALIARKGPPRQRLTHRQTFAAVENYISWNLPAPRLGMTYDVTGNGKTVLKANYGTYWWNPGADFVFNVSPNAASWWRRYRWNDLNNDNRWQPGEEGAQTDARGGASTESIDPDLKNSYTKEIATFFERECGKFGVRAGYVCAGERTSTGDTTSTAVSAFTGPVTVSVGADGVVVTKTTEGHRRRFDPRTIFRAADGESNHQRRQQDSDYNTLENHRNKRMRTAGAPPRKVDKELEKLGTIQERGPRQRAAGNPNDMINTADGGSGSRAQRQAVRTELPWWGIGVADELQQGVPFGRTFASRGLWQRALLDEPWTRAADPILITDMRVGRTEVRSDATSRVLLSYNLNNEIRRRTCSGAKERRSTSARAVPQRLARIV